MEEGEGRKEKEDLSRRHGGTEITEGIRREEGPRINAEIIPSRKK